MGSDNSTPVQQADVVHTESHQDVMEIRFDHMAFGGTVALIIIIALLIYLFRLKRKFVKLWFQWKIVIYGVSEDHLKKVSLVH